MDTSASTITTMGLVSQMAYLTLGAEPLVDGQLVDQFTDGGVTYHLGTTYKVIDHTDDSTLSGFEALLLQDTNTKQYVIAFRGTEKTSAIDWITDILVETSNINLQYSAAFSFVNNALGKTYNDVTVTKDNLTLTGHSLGGMLTQQVGATLDIGGYAFNPFGMEDLLTHLPGNNLTSIMGTALYNMMSSVGLGSEAVSWAKEHILNVSYNDFGFLNGDPLSNFASQLTSHDFLGTYLPVFGKNEDFLDGHSMPILNAAIAHYKDVLSHFTTDTTFANLSAAYLSVGNYEKVENTFTDLNIYGATNLTFNFLTDKSSEQLNSKDPANLYALLNLNPFAIEGNLPAYKTIDASNYSDMYMKKRSEMLYYSIDTDKRYKPLGDNVAAYKDTELDVLLHNSTLSGRSYATDMTTDRVIFDSDRLKSDGSVQTFNWTLTGAYGDDYIFGMGGNDTIYGDRGDDYLEGGAGQDTLYGGDDKDTLVGGISKTKDDGEADILVGGAGYDTYIAGNGDTIEDSDGSGRVFFNDRLLNGGAWDKDKQAYVGDGGTYTKTSSGYQFTSDDGQTLTLNIPNGALGFSFSGAPDDDPLPNAQDEAKTNGNPDEDFSSPLVLDLNHDNTLSTPLYNSQTYFDMDGDGFAEKTAWVQEGDGLLVLVHNQCRVNNFLYVSLHVEQTREVA